MTKLIITRGLPASGKTTRARVWVAEDPTRRARVNRDDIRALLHDSAYVGQSADTQGTERSVTAVRDAAISALLKRGVDVVSDDTNLPTRTARDLRRLATLAGAEFAVWDLTDVALETCLERNAARWGAAKIPDRVLRDMHRRFIAGRPHPLPVPNEIADTDAPAPYVPDCSKPRAIIVDVDGTVALMGSRSPYDETRVHEDRPNWPVIAAVRALYTAGHEVIFCSGRTDACRDATEKWLVDHMELDWFTLLMRRVGDGRRDAVVKRELFDQHIRHQCNIIGVFDDRRQVVDMWRSLGLTVFQVADGNF